MVLGIVAWCAWAVIAACVVLDLGARINGTSVRRIPGLLLPQLTAGRLITLSALLFISLPAPIANRASVPPTDLTTSAATAAPAAAPTKAPVPVSKPSTAEVAPSAAPDTRPTRPTRPTQTYVVKRGDSLWRIAEQHLGNGRRYDEIVALNGQLLNGEPDFITPGTVLRLPAAEQPDGSTYVVQQGDTLSEIAEERIGDAAAYPRIVEASDDTVQPDGARLRDPDLIRPGWNLTIPHHGPPSTTEPDGGSATQNVPPRPGRGDATRTPAPPPAPGAHPADAPTSPPSSSEATSDVVPGWVLPGLTGTGAVLAGSLLLVLRQHRRTQLRYRRPGRIVAPPPDELRPAEKTAQVTGSVSAPKVDVLDRALRDLAAAGPAPRVEIAFLDDDLISLSLAQEQALPPPWTGAGRSWKVPLTADFTRADGTDPPYPLLVSVGAAEGRLVLVNLEELRCTSLTGQPSRCLDLGRHIAAELSLNPWATLVEIDTLGLGTELATIDPLRLHTHEAEDAHFLEQLTAELESEATDIEPDRFRALVATTSHNDPDRVRRIAKIVSNRDGRPATAVMAIGRVPLVDDVQLTVDSEGRASLPRLDLTFTAAGLSADEAAACAAIVDLTRDVDDAPIPVDTNDSGRLTDQSGALRNEVTEPRTHEPPGDESLLPDTTEAYVQKAATTSDDIERLAPVVPAAVKKVVLEKDPTLDAAVSRWFDAGEPVPRLMLLGPVNARGTGDAKAVARRKPYYVELLAYLALHPHGVTSSQVGDAFGIRPDRARTDLAMIRRWLGTNPTTGTQFLPSARSQQRRGAAGGAIYRLEGVLTDVDIFRRLRARGQARGGAGIEDLATALRLVSGEPFTATRPAGWSWLLDEDRLDHIMTCAIVDVAHIVTTHALATNDLQLARFATDVSHLAAPDDEVAQLDRIEVARASGRVDIADRVVAERILNRADDILGAVETSSRTRAVLEHPGAASAS
ncbi:LysM peptidoglycan-binding domain-containing protein [Nocardioides sambongensis]|uniref:LysM peptidoglycan-binding domain-containing protein n=1 Tax=Nocardioides sambongensis TaxID=2589074 RepID=UPI0015E85962|nr:LysM peptidoglycan-binding domain-containing protein [Nocardioides sambongensis]